MKIKKKLLVPVISSLALGMMIQPMSVNTVYAGSDNNIVKHERVQYGYIFNDTDKAPILRIDDDGRDFGRKEYFKLTLKNAKWLTDDDFENSTFKKEMESLSNHLTVTRKSDTTVKASVYGSVYYDDYHNYNPITDIPMLIKAGEEEGEASVAIESESGRMTHNKNTICMVLDPHIQDKTYVSIEHEDYLNDTFSYEVQLEPIQIEETYVDVWTDMKERKYKLKLPQGFEWTKSGKVKIYNKLAGATGFATINKNELDVTVHYSHPEYQDTIYLEGASIKALPTASSGFVEVSISGDELEEDMIRVTKYQNPNDQNRIIYPINESKMYMGGKEIQTDASNWKMRRDIYISLKSLAKGLNVPDDNITWDESTQTLSILKGDNRVTLRVYRDEYGNRKTKLTCNNISKDDYNDFVEIKDGSIFVDAEEIFEMFGYEVDKDYDGLKVFYDPSHRETYRLEGENLYVYKDNYEDDLILDLDLYKQATIKDSHGNKLNRSLEWIGSEELAPYLMSHYHITLDRDIPTGTYEISAWLEDDPFTQKTFNLIIGDREPETSTGSSHHHSHSSHSSGGSSKTSTTPSDNKTLEKALKNHEDLHLSFENRKSPVAEISKNVINEIIDKDKNLKLEHKGIVVVLSKDTLAVKELESADKEASLEIMVQPMDQKNRKNLVEKAIKDSDLSSIDTKVFKVSCKIKEDKENQEITVFNEPMAVSINLSDKKLSEDEIKNLTGIRYEENKDKVIPIKLGGTYDKDKKTFTFYTNKYGTYGILKGKDLRKIQLSLGATNAHVNNEVNTLELAPTVIKDRTMLPLRFVAEALGAKVEWKSKTQTVKLHVDGQTLSLKIGEKQKEMDVAPMIQKGRTLVPLRYVSEKLGANVMWFPSKKGIQIVK